MMPKHIKQLQSRSRKLTVDRLDNYTFLVESASDSDQTYTVKLIPDSEGRIHSTCTCEWSQHHGIGCVHVLATLNHVAERKGRKLSYWDTEADAKRQNKRTFELAGNNATEQVWITSRAS